MRSTRWGGSETQLTRDLDKLIQKAETDIKEINTKMDPGEKEDKEIKLKRLMDIHAESTSMRSVYDWVSQLGQNGKICAYPLIWQEERGMGHRVA